MPRWSRSIAPSCAVLLLLAIPCPGALAGPRGDAAPAASPTPPPPSPSPEPPPAEAPPAVSTPAQGAEAAAPEGPPREGADAGTEASSAEKPVIGQVVVDGNVRVSDSAFYNSLKLKPGDPYDEQAIQDEFRRMWDLDLFDDIVVESRKRDARTVDLIFHVRDRPLINNVAFVGMKAVTETNIQERLVQAKAEVRRGEPVDFSVLRRAEAAIEQLLAEKGYLQARCKARLTAINASQREVTFDIREGAKTKIKKIDFIGNTVFSDAKLRKSLKLTKQAFWLTSWASSKSLYHPAKFDQDSENIRTAYKSLGYLDIALKPEVVELESEVKRRERLERLKREGKEASAAASSREAGDEEGEEDAIETEIPAPAPPPGETERQRKKRVKAELKAKKKREKQPKKWVYLTVPVEEGPQYRVGTIEVEGNRVFSLQEVMARLPLRTGMVFNDSALKYGTKRIEDDYGERGYFYVSLDPQVDRHERVADLKLAITEDKKYSVDRIEFTGNTTTRDAVLRREMRLNEGDLFNVRLLRLGIRKIAQLGYFQVGEDPVVKPESAAGQVDIEVQGTESNRNEIQVGGGVSGLEGGFFQASYSTRNFLGRGEVLSTFIQNGARANRYSINFTEPYLLGKPWTLGFSLFKRETDFVGFKQLGSGGSVFIGRLLGNFSRVDFGYGYETVDFVTSQAGFAVNRQTSATSSLTSVYSHDTRNNFFRPTRGSRVSTSVEYAGGVLGGDNYFVKPRIDTTLYLPGLARRHYIGLNASYGYVQPFGGKVVPTFERYFLGGERSLRVFRSRQVSPARRDQDLNGNGTIDRPEDVNRNGVLDPGEDANGNGRLDCEDLNGNGVLDPGEDANGNGQLDCEDGNRNGLLDRPEDQPDGVWTAFCPADDTNMNGIQETEEDLNRNGILDPGEDVNGNGVLDHAESDHGNCRLDPGEDTNGDGAYGTVFPGGNQFVLLNAEYTIPLGDTVEIATFYDAGNAFDDRQTVKLNDLRVDYGFELRFYLPVFQAPLRLIYGFIQNPRRGEDRTNFIFSIGTTF